MCVYLHVWCVCCTSIVIIHVQLYITLQACISVSVHLFILHYYYITVLHCEVLRMGVGTKISFTANTM